MPGGDRHAGMDHRGEHPGRLGAAVVPGGVQAQRVDHRVGAGAGGPGARRREAVGARDGAGPGDHAVDVGGLEAGVADRLQRGVQRQRHHALLDAAPDLGLADAGDDAGVLELAHDAGRKKGMNASPRASKATSTAMPIVGASQSTTRAIRRRPGLLGELDDGEHERDLEAGHPLLAVDRVRVDRPATADRARARCRRSSTSGSAGTAGAGSSRRPGSARSAARRQHLRSRTRGSRR